MVYGNEAVGFQITSHTRLELPKLLDITVLRLHLLFRKRSRVGTAVRCGMLLNRSPIVKKQRRDAGEPSPTPGRKDGPGYQGDHRGPPP